MTMFDSFTYQRDIVAFVRDAMPAAIEFAEREIAATERAAAYWRGVYRERGTCPLGHPIFVSTKRCGYCENARNVDLPSGNPPVPTGSNPS